MRRGKDASLKALISAMAEAESKSYYEEQENALNDLSGLLKTFLNRDDSPERVRIRKDYEAGAALTGKGGIRQRLGAVDMEFFGRAYFPHYFSRPSPEFHRELDAIWQDGVLKRAYAKHTGAGQADQPDEWLQTCSSSSPWTCQVHQPDV